MWRDQSKPRGAHDAKGPLIMVRCPRDDDECPHTIALAFQAATRDKRFCHLLRAGADRLQYYDCVALCSAGRSLRELSTALRICWTLSAPSNRINGKISARRYPPCQCTYSGRAIVLKAMLYATQMRAGD